MEAESGVEATSVASWEEAVEGTMAKAGRVEALAVPVEEVRKAPSRPRKVDFDLFVRRLCL